MRHRDLSNLAALTSIQVSNAVLPLLVFPHALGVAGSSLYGKLAVAEGIVLAVLTLVLYSFEVDGVSRIASLSLERNRDEISRVFSTVFYSRLTALGLCTLAGAAAWSFADPTLARMVGLWMGLPVAYVFQSTWLFQALERNIVVAALTVASRMLCIVLVLLLVRTPDDVFRVPVIISASYLASGFLSLVYARVWMGLRLHWVGTSEVRRYYAEGREIFLGNLSVLLYRDCNVLILGALHNPSAVALYSISEKLIKGIQATMRPLNQFYFPKVLRLLSAESKADRTTLAAIGRKVRPQLLALVGLLLLTAFAFGATEVHGTFDLPPSERHGIALLALLMSAGALAGVANYMFGVVGLNFLGERTYLFRSILAVGVTSVLVCALLSWRFGATGAAIAFALAEVMLLGLILRRYRVREATP